MIKRYGLFAGQTYYPNGGMSDYRGDFDSIEEAMQYFNAHRRVDALDDVGPFDWCEVVDLRTMMVVKEGW